MVLVSVSEVSVLEGCRYMSSTLTVQEGRLDEFRLDTSDSPDLLLGL